MKWISLHLIPCTPCFQWRIDMPTVMVCDEWRTCRTIRFEHTWSCAAASMHHISFTTTICTKINGANHYLRAKTKSGHFQFMKSSKIGILTSLGVNKDEAGLRDGVQWMTTRMDLPTTLWFWKRKRHPIRNLLTLCSSKILSRTLWLALCCQRPDSYNPKETTSTTWSASLCQQSISK